MATKGSQASDQEVRICMATKGSKHQTRILHGNQGVPCNISGRSGHARDRIGNVDHEIGQSVMQQSCPTTRHTSNDHIILNSVAPLMREI